MLICYRATMLDIERRSIIAKLSADQRMGVIK